MIFYIIKTGADNEKWKNSTKFFSIFTVSSFLLVLPYLSVMASFFTSFFTPNLLASSTLSNQIDHPLGFGLTYWSVYLLNRLLNLPVTNSFVSSASFFSILLVVASLILVYWKIGKFSRQVSAFDLALIMLLPLFALFLGYRIICEQFFVWLIPFLIILYVGGRIKNIYFWGLSTLALLYSVLNCPFPFFFLSLAPWYSNSILGVIHAIWAVEAMRITALGIIGSAFSVLLIILLARLIKGKKLERIES